MAVSRVVVVSGRTKIKKFKVRRAPRRSRANPLLLNHHVVAASSQRQAKPALHLQPSSPLPRHLPHQLPTPTPSFHLTPPLSALHKTRELVDASAMAPPSVTDLW
jgi:hypothetical protein